MVQRLPIPGSDNGTWGGILNGFLEVAHNVDGTLLSAAVTNALPSPIPTTNLGSGTASSTTYLRGDGSWSPIVTNANLTGDVTSVGNVTTLTSSTNVENIISNNATVTAKLNSSTAATTYATQGANTTITALTGLTTPLSVGQGGTGANTLNGLVTGNGTSALSTVAAPAGSVVGTTDAQTLSNKTMASPILAGGAVVTLTYASTIATNASLGNIFYVTLTGNATIANPTNPVAGQKIIYQLKQDATGSRTVSWGANFRFGSDIPTPTLTTTPVNTDYIGFIYNSIDTFWDCVAVARGY